MASVSALVALLLIPHIAGPPVGALAALEAPTIAPSPPRLHNMLTLPAKVRAGSVRRTPPSRTLVPVAKGLLVPVAKGVHELQRKTVVVCELPGESNFVEHIHQGDIR